MHRLASDVPPNHGIQADTKSQRNFFASSKFFDWLFVQLILSVRFLRKIIQDITQRE
jgi:hypothetical protein